MEKSNGEEKTQALVVNGEKTPEVQRFELMQRMARLFAMSGLFADIKGSTPEQGVAQAFVKMSLGESMGFSPAESMTGLSIIQGRLAVNAELRGARMQRSGYDWDILTLDDQGCWLQLKRDGKPVVIKCRDGEGHEYEQPAIASFTADDARKAGLFDKDNWKKWREDMYFARALTRLQRRYAPGVLGLSLLSSEEITSDPSLQTPVVEKPTIQQKAKSSLEDVKSKYRKTMRPEAGQEGTGTAGGAETASPNPAKAATRQQAEDVKKPISGHNAEGTVQPPAASKLTEQLKASVAKEDLKSPTKLFEEEDGWS
jgi:hypothetical protein